MGKRVWLGMVAAAALASVADTGAASAADAAKAVAAPDFDARRAKDVAAVVTSNGASGELKTGSDGKLSLDAQAARIFFDVYFDDCDAARTLCNTLIFSGSWDTTKVNGDQVNRWNRWTLYCPAYLDEKGKPQIWEAVGVSERTSKDDVANDVDRWMGCLQDFDNFIAAPEDFLKRNAAPQGPATTVAPAPPVPLERPAPGSAG